MSGGDPSRGEAVDALLSFLRSPGYEPLAQRQLLHRLHVPAKRLTEFRRAIRALLEEGRIVRVARGRLAAAPSRATLVGTLRRHRDGYGFVIPDDGSEDLFIAPHDLKDGAGGDRVEVGAKRPARDGRQRGVVLRVLERGHTVVLGVYTPGKTNGCVRPFDPGVGEVIAVRGADAGGARKDQVVRVEIVARGAGGTRGKVLEVLGGLEEPGVDVQVVAEEFGLATDFPQPVIDAATRLPARIPLSEKRRRERFDTPPPVTIDGETAQDFDDAIAVEETERGYRLYVHIADVSHFVVPDEILDREALRRGTSVYFPGTVLPMLPAKLSNDLCSLRPNVDRLVQSVVLDIDRQGGTSGTRIADGVIRSAARLTYAQVGAVLDGERRVKGVPTRLLPMLHATDGLRRVLERRRLDRGGIDFDLPEPNILLDVEGVMTGVEITPRNKAHRLIEECMIVANEAVAGWLEERGHPCMYRVHDPPDPQKLETLERFARFAGLQLPDDPWSNPSVAIQTLLTQAEGSPQYRWVGQLALRSMQQARYSMVNVGHYGLAAPTYCHFTSPIRRYPDLVVHRLLRSCRKDETARAAGLAVVAQSSSERERSAEAAERQLLSWKKVVFMSGREGQEFDGVVTGVAPFGLFVQLDETLAEGMIRVEKLGSGRYTCDEGRLELRSQDGGRSFRLGDRFRVSVDRVDRVLRRLDFSLATPITRATQRPKARARRPVRKGHSHGSPSRGRRRR